jgi:hypothetical protein
MIKRDARGMMVQNMAINGAVKEMTPDEAEVSVDGRGSAAEETPA